MSKMGQCLKGRRERPFGKNVHFHEARWIEFDGHIAFFKEFELVGKFFKRATKNRKMLCDHALQTHIQSKLRPLYVDNFKIILSLQKQLNL